MCSCRAATGRSRRLRSTRKSNSRSPHVLVGGGKASGNKMLDELNNTMHNKTLFRKTLLNYLPKDKKKRTRVLRELCKRLSITGKTEMEQINSIRQCCIDNNNSSVLNLGFKAIVSFLVWMLMAIGFAYAGGLGLHYNARDLYSLDYTKGATPLLLLKMARYSFGLFLSVLSAGVGKISLKTAFMQPIIILFNGSSDVERYKTMKAYLMEVNKKS